MQIVYVTLIEVWANAMVVSILQYINVSTQHIVYLEFIQCHMSIISKKLHFKHILRQPWLVWPSYLGILPQSKRLPVRFLVRAHAWVAGSVPSRGMYERQPINVFFSHWYFPPSFSLPSPLSKNKWIKSFKNILRPIRLIKNLNKNA